MDMDVYNCEECARAFSVEKDADVLNCPSCGSKLFEFSHEAVLVLKVKRPLTMPCEKVS